MASPTAGGVIDHDRGASFGEARGDACANALGRSGHAGDLSGKCVQLCRPCLGFSCQGRSVVRLRAGLSTNCRSRSPRSGGL